MIDQADADSFPTTIVFGGIPFYGIEDLPYFNKILFKTYAASRVGSSNKPPFHVYLIYEMWNPHQASTSEDAPSRFRVRINDESTYRYSVRSAPNVVTIVSLTPEPLAGIDGDPLEFSVSTGDADVQKSYREPRLIRTGSAATSRADLGGVNAVRMPDITGTPTTPGTLPYNTYWIAHGISKAVFILDTMMEPHGGRTRRLWGRIVWGESMVSEARGFSIPRWESTTPWGWGR